MTIDWLSYINNWSICG